MHGSNPGHHDLSGLTAVVTGGASGIGRACVRSLRAARAEVLILDRDGKAAKELANEVGGTPVEADLADLAAVDQLELPVDIVVNNAGLQHVAPVTEFPPETFALLLRVMVEAPFRIVRRVLPRMYRQHWGRIVNVSSVHGLRASAGKAAYVAAKHGIEGLSKVLAVEGAAHGVTANCVAPGYVRTPLVLRQLADQAERHGITEADALDRLLARTPGKRLIEPAEVAEVVTFLCSRPASSITGTSLTVDGGWTAT